METIKLGALNLKPGAKILDLGCGEGRHALALRTQFSAIDIFAVDIDHKSLSVAKEKNSTLDNYVNDNTSQSTCFVVQADGMVLPFPENSFDVIICSEVLEHIKEYSGFLHEIKRLLKKDGIFALSVPRAWPEKICWRLSEAYHQVEGGHVRIFDARKLNREVQQYGFNFMHRHWSHALHSPYWWLRCLYWAKGEDQWFVRLYHRLLVWDLMKKPWLTQNLEKILNPVLGKSIVMYYKNLG